MAEILTEYLTVLPLCAKFCFSTLHNHENINKNAGTYFEIAWGGEQILHFRKSIIVGGIFPA